MLVNVLEVVKFGEHPQHRTRPIIRLPLLNKGLCRRTTFSNLITSRFPSEVGWSGKSTTRWACEPPRGVTAGEKSWLQAVAVRERMLPRN